MEVRSMIDMVVIKKDMLLYLQDVVLCKVRLVSLWINRREVVEEFKRIRSDKLREH